MKISIGIAPFLSLGILSLAAGSHASLITNGDFETGAIGPWSNSAGATIVTGGSALDGTYSLFLPGGSGGGSVGQTFAPITSGAYTTKLIFSMPDPGADRGFNAYWGATGSQQINLRVVDVAGGSDGDVQIFSTAWNTVLTDVVSFTGTNNLQLTINNYGGAFNYDLSVNGASSNGLTFSQNGVPTHLARFALNNQFGTSPFTVDNISIAVPEPASATLLTALLCAFGFSRRKRRRLP